jgi:molybdopterin-guanine dinucleotide biosynthesis protein A
MKTGRSAIVLAGGRSSRMGADKTTLPLGGMTMLGRVVMELWQAFDEVVVVAGPHQSPAHSALSGTAALLICDAEQFQGPVKALRMGLAAVHHEVAFACACDLPMVSRELAVALCNMAAGRDAAIPLVESRLQVLHAAYRKSCIPLLDAMIARGERRLQNLSHLLNARIVTEDELRYHDPELLSFFNVNTPGDYARAQQIEARTRFG